MLPRNSNALVGLQGCSSFPCPACLLPSTSDIRCGCMYAMCFNPTQQPWRMEGTPKKYIASTEAKGLTFPLLLFSRLGLEVWHSSLLHDRQKKTIVIIKCMPRRDFHSSLSISSLSSLLYVSGDAVDNRKREVLSAPATRRNAGNYALLGTLVQSWYTISWPTLTLVWSK